MHRGLHVLSMLLHALQASIHVRLTLHQAPGVYGSLHPLPALHGLQRWTMYEEPPCDCAHLLIYTFFCLP